MPKPPKAKTITQALQSSQGALGRIVRAMQQHHELSDLIQKHLPAEFEGQVKVLTYQSGILRLGVNNQALASKLRFMQADFLSTLRQTPQWCGVSSIEIKLV